jgi:hypothetical protein
VRISWDEVWLSVMLLITCHSFIFAFPPSYGWFLRLDFRVNNSLHNIVGSEVSVCSNKLPELNTDRLYRDSPEKGLS